VVILRYNYFLVKNQIGVLNTLNLNSGIIKVIEIIRIFIMKIFTDHQARWLTGIGLLSIVGLIGWIDNFFIMWLFLGVFIYLLFMKL